MRFALIISLLFVFAIYCPINLISKDKNNSIIIETGAGLGISTDTLAQAGSRAELSFTLRALWKPEYLLSVGIETGWLSIADFDNSHFIFESETTKVDATLDAIPLMLIFDMNIWSFDLYTGLGYYYVMSELDAFDTISTSGIWNVGFYLALDYKFLIRKKVCFGTEIKWSSIGELGKTILSAQIYISYNIIHW